MTEFTGLDIEMTFKDHYHEASCPFLLAWELRFPLLIAEFAYGFVQLSNPNRQPDH